MIEIITARNGQANIKVNNVFLHSRVNPGAEGQKLATEFLQSNNQATITVVGLGLAYHILPLLNAGKSVKVFEPNQQIIKAVKNNNELANILNKIEFIPSLQSFDNCFVLPNYKQFVKLSQPTQANKLTSFKGLKVLCDFPIYGGSVTTAKYTLNAFSELGCNVKSVSNPLANNLFQQLLKSKSKNKLSLMLTELLSQWFYDIALDFKPDVCFFNAQSPITPELIKTLKQHNILCVFWFVEDFRRFAYWQTYAPLFDLFLVIQTDEILPKLAQMQTNAIYLPMAACTKHHKPIKPNKDEEQTYACDIAFMGAGYQNRHNLFENLLEYDLKIWGTDWLHNPKLKPYIQKNGQRVDIEETAKIYANAKININLHSSSDDIIFDTNPDFVNPRTFEIMACGGFQICDRRTLLADLFIEDEEIVLFSSLNELKQKIDYYLNNEDERVKIAEAGKQKVLQNHTYVHRMQAMFNKLQSLYPQKFNFAKKADLSKTDYKLIEFIKQNFDNVNLCIEKASEIITNSNTNLQKHEAILLMLNEYLQMKKG